MKVRFKQDGSEGSSSSFNTHSTNEVLVVFEDGYQDSIPISDLDIFIESKGIWVDMAAALTARDIVVDNFNEHFREAKVKEDYLNGYY